MAVGGINNEMDSDAKAKVIPRVNTRLRLSVENEQADAGRDGRTCLARPDSQARTGTGKNSFSLLS